MYLISVYFDEKTNLKLKKFMNKVAEKSGNHYMICGNVPPHMTISAFEAFDEEEILDMLDSAAEYMKKGKIQLVSVGSFPGVLFVSAVLDQYLHEISVRIYEKLSGNENIKVSKLYRPFQWFPHVTIGKKLSSKEIQEAFEVLYHQFELFQGDVVKIGLAKTNPYHNLKEWDLKNN